MATGDSNPFEGMPFFGDMMRMLSGQGPVQWDGARQLALSIATEGQSEPNIDPLARIRYEQLARVADLQVADATGLSTSTTGRVVAITPVTRTQWVLDTLDVYRPLVEAIAAALKTSTDSNPPDPTDLPTSFSDPTEAWFGQIMGLLSPMLLGMTAGSLVGHLATSSFGSFDLPVPRPPSDDIAVIATNIDRFGTDWSMDEDDLQLWVCVHQITSHSILGMPHVRSELNRLLLDYAGAFEFDPDSITSRFADLDLDMTSGDPMASFQNLMSDPDVILGAVRTDRQHDIQVRLHTLVAVITGYVDHIMDTVGTRLIGSYPQVTEAMRRERVEASASDRFVTRLLGLDLTQDLYDRGRQFVDGVLERAGTDGLERLWSAAEVLPTPNELDAPGLWLARIDL